VDELTYQIGVIKLNAKGTIVQGKTIDADIVLDVPDIGKAARLFLWPEDGTRGSIALNLSMKDLRFSFDPTASHGRSR